MIPEQIPFTEAEEGVRLTRYHDQLGLPTIGVGHRCAEDQPPISLKQAEDWLREDLGKAEAQALALCPNLKVHPWPLAALTDLCFNAGARGLQGKDVHDPSDDAGLVKALRAEHWRDAAQRFKQYCHGHLPDGTVVELPVLKRRREHAAVWILKG